MELKYKADNLKRAKASVENLEEELKLARENLKTKKEEYTKEWAVIFERSCQESRLSWCTYCGVVKDSNFLTEPLISLNWGTDHYDPTPVLKSSSVHRACSDCAPRLNKVEDAESKTGGKWDRKNIFKLIPKRPYEDHTIKELTERLKLPPYDPTSND